jgi:NADPH-dependent curcumin reductase CurA
MPAPQPPATHTDADADEYAEPEAQPRSVTLTDGESTGHPAVDAVLRSLANAARLAPAEQIAEYEAAHRVLQETLSSIDS